MKEAPIPSQYLRISLDLAQRISKGELPEGSRVYGRSVLASEYGVSPETVRRALCLLADSSVVETLPQSGTVVLSAAHARRYLENYSDNADFNTLRRRLMELVGQHEELGREIAEVSAALVQRQKSLFSATQPLPNYELAIPGDSPLLGRSIGALNFWQRTGATIIAIRREENLILSPGPHAELLAGDVLLLVGTLTAVDAAHRLIHA